MFKICLALLFGLCFSQVIAEEEAFSLVNLTQQPIRRVHGTVNVITGDWVDQEEHLKPTGPDSYAVGHSYVSSHICEGTLSDAWNFWWPSTLEESKFFLDGSDSQRTRLTLKDSGGAELVYTNTESYSKFTPVLENSGYTHIATIDHPVVRDPYRATFEKNYTKHQWILMLSDGTVRIYSKTKEQSSGTKMYHITKEVLPSKNERLFAYDKDDVLISIKTMSSCGTYTIQKVTIQQEKDTITAKSLDGKEVVFSLTRRWDNNNKKYSLVDKIQRPGAPDRRYTYCQKSPRHERRIEHRSWATGLVEEAKFYGDSTPTIEGHKVEMESDVKKFAKQRVREIRTKRFCGEELFTKNAFRYSFKGGPKHKVLEVSEADGSSTGYLWNPQKHIIWLGYADAKEKRLLSERFKWNEQRLVQRAVYDEQKRPRFVRQWKFNKHGFPVKEKLYGLFTSISEKELRLDDEHEPKQGESLSFEATWDDEGRLLSRSDADGNWTYFSYDRCFVTAKYICLKKDRILRREFASYDSAGCLTESILDDGRSRDKDCMDGVHRRHIVRIHSRKRAPRFGEPEKKELLVWTKEDGLILLMKEYFIRDEQGRVIKHTTKAADGLERTSHFEYDSIDRLVATTRPDGTKETVSYDPLSGLISSKTTPLSTIFYTYDLFSRIIAEKEVFEDKTFFEKTFEYDKAGRTVTVRDSRGRTTITEKDVLGRVIKTIFPELPTEEGKKSPVETVAYKGRDVISTSALGAVTTTTYSSFGKPLRIQHPTGYETTVTYDVLGREIKRFDGLVTSTKRYDDLGRIVRTEVLDGSVVLSWQGNTYRGDDLIETENEFLKTKFTYDAQGRIIKKSVKDTATEESVVEEMLYDGFSRLICKKTSLGCELFFYDVNDRVVEKQHLGSSKKMLQHIKTVYDAAGRVIETLIEKTADEWLSTKTTYGAFGLPSMVVSADGTASMIIYELKGTKWKKKTIDALGISSEEIYAANDVVVRKRVVDAFGKKLSECRTTLTLLGKPAVLEKDIFYKNKLETTVKTHLSYDIFGRLVRVKEASGTSEEVCSYKSYDGYGRCVEETTPSGIRLLSTYDVKGRLVRKTSSDNSIDTQFFYTKHDCIEKAIDVLTNKETRRSYDGFGHLLRETQSNGLTVKYAYTHEGLLKHVALPDASEISYTYESGLLVQAKRKTRAFSYQFAIVERNRMAQIVQTALPMDGGKVLYTYDTLGRPLEKIQRYATDVRKYDRVGRITSRRIDAKDEMYQYDDLSQLISDNGSMRAYDSTYRLREKEGVQAEVTLRNQMTALGAHKMSYDKDGRRICDAKAHLSYDALGRLVRYERDGLTEIYEYDVFSRRMRKTTMKEGENRKRELYLWIGQQEVGTYDSHHACTSFRLLAEGVGLDGGATVAVELNDTPYSCFTDLSGNIRTLASVSGDVVHQASYSAFSRTSTEGIVCPWGYFSKRHDATTGYVMFLYRLYDPLTSVWLTQDPLGLEGGPNLYAYVLNNPMNVFDRLGLFGEGFCDMCRSTWDSVCDFCHGLADSFCSGVSEVGGSVRDGLSSACSCVGGAIDSCVRSAERGCSWAVNEVCSRIDSGLHSVICGAFEAVFGPRSVSNDPHYFETGARISPDTSLPAGVYVFPKGHCSAFIAEARQNPSLWSKVSRSMFCNGMLTSAHTCCSRAKRVIDADKAISYVIMLINPTDSFLQDLGETCCQITNISTGVVSAIKSDLMTFFDAFCAAEEKMDFALHAHSQGAAIARCLLKTPEFNREGNGVYSQYVTNVYTYGGASLIGSGTNFIVPGDIIPLLNPFNWGIMLLHPGCIEFTSVKLQTPLGAHGFDNDCYQQAYKSTN